MYEWCLVKHVFLAVSPPRGSFKMSFAWITERNRRAANGFSALQKNTSIIRCKLAIWRCHASEVKYSVSPDRRRLKILCVCVPNFISLSPKKIAEATETARQATSDMQTTREPHCTLGKKRVVVAFFLICCFSHRF